MSKFLNHITSNKRKSWHNHSSVETRTPMPTTSSLQQGRHNHRRVAILNKLFMKHITDVMATGDISSQLLHRGVEVSRVKVTSDITHVLIYWQAKGSKHDETTETILSEYASKLRHELAQLRLIGSIPHLTFIKDKTYNRLIDVDKRLAVADFGEDHIPVDPSLHFKSEFILNVEFSPKLKERLESCEEASNFPEEDPLPDMRMDVLGIDQAEIMDKVRNSVKKSKALHRLEPETESPATEKQWPGPGEETSDVADNIAEHFIRQRRLKSKLLKGPKNYQPERDLLQPSEWWAQDSHHGDGDREDQDYDYWSDGDENFDNRDERREE